MFQLIAVVVGAAIVVVSVLGLVYETAVYIRENGRRRFRSR
jgi:hypothetical protein